MKGSLHQSYDYSSIITADDLKKISSLVTSKFKFVKFEIKTKEGGVYCADKLDDILQYDNHDYRKIVLFRVSGNNQERDSFAFPCISISLYDNSIYKESCTLDIRDVEESEIVYFSQRVKDYTNQIKTPYWWCYKNAFYFCLGIILYILFSIIYFANVNNDGYNKIYNVLILQGISALCMYISLYFGKKIISYFFPEGCFCIGEQKKHIRRKKKYRDILLWTILVGLAVGIIAGLATTWIANSLF